MSFFPTNSTTRNIIYNLEKYLNLGHLKLDDMPKFCAAYFATCGDNSIFTEPPSVDRSAEDSNDKSPLLDKHDGFVLKPRKLV